MKLITFMVPFLVMLADLSQLHAQEKPGQPVDTNNDVLESIKPPTPEEALRLYTRNITELQKAGELKPIIGRQELVFQIEGIVRQPGMKALFLLGDAGAGKTALVEALQIEGKEIVELDRSSLLAGSGLQGMIEARIKALIEALTSSKGKYILFVDEFHALMDVKEFTQAIKPALARGTISMIAATTGKEFRKYVETDTALVSRTKQLDVPMLTAAEVITMLRAQKAELAERFQVQILDSALQSAQKLAARYYPDEPVTRQAKKLLESALMTAVLEQKYGNKETRGMRERLQSAELERKSLEQDLRSSRLTPQQTTELNQQIQRLQLETEKLSAILKQTDSLLTLKKEVGQLTIKIKQLELTQDFPEIANTKVALAQTQERLVKLSSKMGLNQDANNDLTSSDIERVVESERQLSPGQLSEGENLKLKNLEARLNSRVIGQTEAVRVIVNAIRQRKANMDPGRKGPVGAFIFVGLPGVGKTEVAKALAEYYYDNPKALVDVSMNKFSEPHSVSTFIDSPVGYVKGEDGGELTEPLRKNRFTVLSLNDAHAAHHAVKQALLPLAEEGIMKDGTGRNIDGRDSILIMSVNSGADYLKNKGKLSPQEIHQSYGITPDEQQRMSPTELQTEIINRSLVRDGFSPELINRMEVIVFNPITFQIASTIMTNLLERQSQEVLKEHNINITFTKDVVEALVRAGFQESSGARDLLRTRNKTVTQLLTDLRLDSDARSGETIQLSFKAHANGQGGELVAQLESRTALSLAIEFQKGNIPNKAASQLINGAKDAKGSKGKLGQPVDKTVKGSVRKGAARAKK